MEKILATLRLHLEITQTSLASEVGLSVRGAEGNLALCPLNPAYEPIMLPADFGADDYRVVGTLGKTL